MMQHHFISQNVRRIILALAIAQLCAGACLCQQQAPAPIVFEVASIKPSSKDMFSFAPGEHGPHVYQGRASYIGMPLKDLFAYAYDFSFYQISAPGWMDTKWYDIEARFPDGATKKDEKKMLQALLKERFKLAFHIETKEGKVYQLVAGKDGAKLTPSSEDLPGTDKDVQLRPGERWEGEGPERHKILTIYDRVRGINHLEDSKITMNGIAGYLTMMLYDFYNMRYPVVDGTGLKGYYQISLDYNLPAQPGSDPQGTDVLDRSLEAQGLKLKMAKAPVDVYVIDHAEQPSDN